MNTTVLLLALVALGGAAFLVSRWRDVSTAIVVAVVGLLMFFLPMGPMIVLIGALSLLPIGLLGYDFQSGKTRDVHHNFLLIVGGALLALAVGITLFLIFEKSDADHTLSPQTLDEIPTLIGMVYTFGVIYVLSYSARIKPYL